MIIQFKQWLYFSEQYVITEDYKTMTAKFIAQGNDPQIVQRYIDDFKQIIKYKQIQDPIGGLENIPPNKRNNIDAYQDFKQLETLVDYVKGQVDIQGRTNFKNLKIDAKPIYEDQNLEIYYADSPQACVTYKGSVPYGWCVARSDSSNMFNAYRYKEHEPAFYFVKNKAKTNAEFSAWNALKLAGKAITQGGLQFKDKYHFFVIQVIKTANTNDATRQQYYVTSALNDGDKEMSWQEITRIEPFLSNLQNVFKPKPLTEQERQFYEKYKNGISDDDFIRLPYHEKDMYINVFVNLDNTLTDKQFQVLPIDLKNKYIGFGVGLSENQLQMIDNKLQKRYEEVTLKKIEKMLEEDLKIILLPTELNILIAYKDKFDLNKLTDKNVTNLLYFAKDRQEMAKLIIQYKKELTDNNVQDLLHLAKDRQEMAKLIIQYKKELTDSNVQKLIAYPTDKQEIAKLIIQYKKELTDNNVIDFFVYATGKQEMAKILGSEKISKLDDFSVKYLLDRATDKQEMANLIIQYKKELTKNNVYGLLINAEDKQEMAKILGSENINKLSDDKVTHLLNYAKDKKEMANILGSENINKLTDGNVRDLLNHATDKQEMAKIILQYKKELTASNIFILLFYATDKQEMAEKLGSANISKLTDFYVSTFLRSAADKQEMARILNHYHNNKTPEIQQHINKYL